MPWYRLASSLVIFFHIALVKVNAEQGVQERYVDVCLKINEAKSLEARGDFRTAVNEFKDSCEDLACIRLQDPDWESEMLSRRIDECQSEIRDLQPKADAQKVAPVMQRPTAAISEPTATNETASVMARGNSTIASSENPALLVKGEALYERLKHNYPDTPILPDHDLAPHTLDISIPNSLHGPALMELSMPLTVWNKLYQADKDALVTLLRSKIIYARAHPEIFADIVPASIAYPGEIANIEAIHDDAWEISVGHLDDEGYLVEDNVVLKGADYSSESSSQSITIIYANAKDDIVYNSGWDGSVSEVEDYHKKYLNDPDSVQYSNWTRVIKTGLGYQVSVTFRAKNELGGYVLHDQTFEFDKQGAITRVTDNAP